MPKGVDEAPVTQLRAIRLKKKLSLATVAEAVGITQAGLSFIERGITTTPRPETAERLAKYYGKKITTLLQAA